MDITVAAAALNFIVTIVFQGALLWPPAKFVEPRLLLYSCMRVYSIRQNI